MGNMRIASSALAPASTAAVGCDSANQTSKAGFAPASLKILHVLRAPLGGLFRHVIDVVRGQAERGHRVGLIVDSGTGGASADATLAALAPYLALGFVRFPINRQLSTRDVRAVRQVAERIKKLAPDVLHGHGAKGAALVRLVPNIGSAIRAYTPHGGSLIYSPGTLSGRFYRSLEWVLNWRTDLFLFESSYVSDLFRRQVGRPRAMVRVVRNGVGDADFEPVVTRSDAADLVCIGELRPVKAMDILIEALALLRQSGRRVSVTIAGEGPDGPKLMAQAERLGIADLVHFIGHCPARKAFTLGRIFVMPSRAESLPYVALEAAAAGMPIIATAVGGVPEIFGAQAQHLIPPDNIPALVGAITAAIDNPTQAHLVAQAVNARVRSDFSLHTMIDGGIAAYREALAMRKLARFA